MTIEENWNGGHTVKLPTGIVSKRLSQAIALKILEGETTVTGLDSSNDLHPVNQEVVASFSLTVRFSRAEADDHLHAIHLRDDPAHSLIDFIVAASHSLQTSICEDECLDDFTIAERMMGWWAERAEMARAAAKKKEAL